MLGKFSMKSGGSDRSESLDPLNVPKHIAIIMDGNGRWAKKRGLPRVAGHREGMKVVRNTVIRCSQLGVEALTLYAFSTENWKRPRPEIDFLMKLPGKFLTTYLPELVEENVQVRTMGSREKLPNHTQKAVEQAIEQTKDNTGLILNFALNYGSRFEIVEAVKALSKDVKTGKVVIDDIDEALMSAYMFSPSLGDPDLLIRTSGEIRLSNFMLWQLAYTELWFTNVLWPDFKEEQLHEAIAEYQKRGRRFGSV
ncbi:MAG TPA: isoprenyl transferase [Bacillales bacterium]|nr:isoprenyl transferase [Bacillales bacterium]